MTKKYPLNRKLGKLRLPAMNCKLGDRGYLVTALRFEEVAARVIDDVRLIHKSEKLAQWIQRRLDGVHARRISDYLKNDDSRFFNALVLGVYGGNPQWAELTVADPNQELNEEEEERVNTTIGVLILTGKEHLFPIDGQHRVAGIMKAMNENPDLAGEEVTVILVGHATSDEGMKRTRRLFVTLNQRAKKVSDKDIVALDEDNGFAVVTRRIIDESALLPKPDLVSDSNSVAIPPTDESAITSILGLYQIIKALYPRTKEYRPRFAVVKRSRPTDEEIEQIHSYVIRYWHALIEQVPEYKRVIRTGTKKAGYYRSDERNHLLFRPVGQHTMAKATEVLVSRGEVVEKAVRALVEGSPMSLFDPAWHSILWDPIAQKMLSNASPAETLLLRNAGRPARTSAADKRLDDLIRLRDNR
jgi:DNA sulfur modification protein DndB